MLAALGCAAPAAPTPALAREAPPPRCAWGAPEPLSASPDGYRYRVSAGPGAAEIRVEVGLPPHGAEARTWALDPALAPFVRDVALAGEGGLTPLRAAPDGGWLVPACADAPGCRLRYRVLLGEAGRALHDFNLALTEGATILSPPSAWLLRPRGGRAPFALTVGTAPGDGFVCGLSLSAIEGARSTVFRGDVGALDDTPYAAFGRLTTSRRRLPGGIVDVAFDGAAGPDLQAWVDGALHAVAAYYDGFPTQHAALIVHVDPFERGVTSGRTMGIGGASVLVSVGERTTTAALGHDWTLVHELVHCSFPDVSTPWAEEGLATYLEPMIRVRAGLCDDDEVWRQLVEGLPKGQPEEGDGGLDVTDTWGRRYWGGAMFWFLADLEIRERTGDARSLDDALRAVNRAGGDVSVRWPLDRALEVADAGAGVAVLSPLRKKLGGAPVRVDLEALWKRLGVAELDGKMVYDDAAPLARVRRAITGRGVPGKG